MSWQVFTAWFLVGMKGETDKHLSNQGGAMKKAVVFAVVLAMLWPVSALAAAQFSLGGYIKLNTFWDSTQNNKNLTRPVQRANDPNFNHGRFFMGAQETRFNFTITGPKVFGAILTGFIEMDFDTADYTAAASGAFNTRVRHAMFRLDWPETELLLGQYHSIFASWSIDAAEASAFQMEGTATARLPQIRLTQKFLGDWSVAGLIGLPNNATLTNANPYGNANNGMAAETPQVQGTIKYAHDWWGKAAYFGHPAPFTVQVTAGWQRNINRFNNAFNVQTFGENNFTPINGSIVSQKFVSPWLVMGTVFVPVIPTHTANLAGTAHLLTQWWIGQGVEAFGIAGTGSNLYKYQRTLPFGPSVYDVSLLKRYGGVVEGQYYFTNQWYLNCAYGITKAYGVDTSEPNRLVQDALQADQMKMVEQVDATLWYRPIQALKFGVQYSWARTDWLQITTDPANSGNTSSVGNEHRVQFVGFFFF
jgi:hypothetical protein